MRNPFYIFVDVDDTFARCEGSRWIPLAPIIEHVRQLARQGAVLYGWSSKGADHARHSARDFGIEECFRGFLPKPKTPLSKKQLAKLRDTLEKARQTPPAEPGTGRQRPPDLQHASTVTP